MIERELSRLNKLGRRHKVSFSYDGTYFKRYLKGKEWAVETFGNESKLLERLAQLKDFLTNLN